jgi:HSP20 family protein
MYPLTTRTRTQRNLLDTLFGDDFLNFGTTAIIDDYSVRTNVSTTNEEYRIDVVAPGLTKEDLNVKIENTQLFVSYDNENTDKSERVYYRSSRRLQAGHSVRLRSSRNPCDQYHRY